MTTVTTLVPHTAWVTHTPTHPHTQARLSHTYRVDPEAVGFELDTPLGRPTTTGVVRTRVVRTVGVKVL